MSAESERRLTFARLAGIVEDVARSRERVWAYFTVAGIEPLVGFSVPVRQLGDIMLTEGLEVMVVLTPGVSEEFDLQPNIILGTPENN